MVYVRGMKLGEGKKKERERGGSVCAWASSGLEHPGAQRQTSRNSGRSMDGRASAAAAYVWRGIPIYFFCVHISFSATIQKKKTNKQK